MKLHNGMRPQDIVVLCKLLTIDFDDWQIKDLSSLLSISPSEVSLSLFRSNYCGLLDHTKRKVFRQSLFDFLKHGIQYVFPQHPGSMVTGIPTAHSYPAFRQNIFAEFEYVWPNDSGIMRGLAITPLYPSVPNAVEKDTELHLLLAAIDIVRVGRPREFQMAIAVLKKAIL